MTVIIHRDRNVPTPLRVLVGMCTHDILPIVEDWRKVIVDRTGTSKRSSVNESVDPTAQGKCKQDDKRRSRRRHVPEKYLKERKWKRRVKKVCWLWIVVQK